SRVPQPPNDGAARPPGAEPRNVRNGSASVEVAAGRVEAATRSLTGTVTGLGGYVEASELNGTAATDDDRAQFASITMRVPSDSFDDLLGGLGEVGTVLSSTTSSRDVTGDYVDLEARIRALETSRSTYLT
nr:DUF4349 domain-containing protein [Micromonospora sp. DSM 115978]